MGAAGGSIELNDIELVDGNHQHIKAQPFEKENLNLASGKKSKGVDPLNQSQSSNSPQCRICWGGEEDDEDHTFNPLISPCNCTGTINSIHLKCLKEWLDTKRQMKIHRG